MLATAADAHELLGDQLERKVANNTRIVRVTDKLAALKLHGTFIAWYGENACLLNVSDWNTRTTWRRINDFTPATPRGRRFLRYIDQPDGDRILYEPDLRVDADGNVLNPMLPSRQRRIENAVSEFMANCKAYAEAAVTRWDNFGSTVCDCQYDPVAEREQQHYLNHLQERDPVLPSNLQEYARRTAANSTPDATVELTRKALTAWAIDNLLQLAVYAADPDYRFLNPNIQQRSLP